MTDSPGTSPLLPLLPSLPSHAANPEEVLTWAREHFPRVGLTCSFGGTGIVLVHMVAKLGLDIPIYLLNTGFLFPETLATRDAFVRTYGVRVIDVDPDPAAAHHAEDLYRTDPDLCCHLRKVLPMARLLAELDAWITGLRRDQGGGRAEVATVEVHRLPDGRPIVKVNPLAHWTKADAWRYILEHRLPYNPLLDQGYKSIGCRPCTRAVAPHEPERAGRWSGFAKTECGLHTFTEKLNTEKMTTEKVDATRGSDAG